MRRYLNVMCVIFILVNIVQIFGHGRLIEPPSRSSAWRFGFNTTKNYNDHELYCGGFTRQWNRNKGECGVCGDAYDLKPPRPNELGGKYGEGVIVRTYNPKISTQITIKVQLTAYHRGYFEFRLCSRPWDNTQQCFDTHPLVQIENNEQKYYPHNGNSIYEMSYQLPDNLKECEHCVLQWKYVAGNNWGMCPNGTGAVGCGPQEEFRGCADIKITSTNKTTESSDSEHVSGSNLWLKLLRIMTVSLICTMLVFTVLFVKYFKLIDKIQTKLKGYDIVDRSKLFVTTYFHKILCFRNN